MLYKPVRVFAPELVTGISCPNNFICSDELSRYSEASQLYDDALQSVTFSLGEVKKRPRVIFCSTDDCFRAFGFGGATANTVGNFGVVIGPEGWRDYYLRHEIIHHIQAEQLGVLAQLFAPAWFIEGMAYSLSDDPRSELRKPFQQYRTEFESWYQTVGNKSLWEEGRKL